MTYGKQQGHLTPCTKSKHHGHYPAWEDCPECPPRRPCAACFGSHTESTELCRTCSLSWEFAWGSQ